MKLFKHISILACIFSFTSQNFGDVKLDDFQVFYAYNPEQCYLGEAYGYSITKKWGSVDTGNGWWSPYEDELGTKITNGKQEEVTETNCSTIVEDGAMHIFFKTHLSTADFKVEWPFAGIYCDLMKDSLDYFDFSNLTEITMRLKGSGKIRVLFQSQDIYEMLDTNGVQVGWGYYGFDITMDSTYTNWKEQTIPAPLLDPERYSPAYDSSWTWDHGKGAVKGLAIQAMPDEDSTTKDSVELWVDDILLKGLDYQATFGFEHDTDVAIYYIPPNNVKMNINITPNKYQKSITISYDLKKSRDVFVAIFDVKGKIISELVNERQGSGKKQVDADFSTRELPSGIYFITFQFDTITVTRKFSFIK